MRSLKISSLIFFTWLIHIFPGHILAQDEFRIGSWCLTGSTNLYNIIQQDPITLEWLLRNDEKTLLENLGLNYMIACTRGYPICTTDGEVALNNYGIERSGAFKSTLEISPDNSQSGTAYQVWRAIDWATGGPTNPIWTAYVDSGFSSMDKLHSDKTGVHSFLTGAEHELHVTAKHSWLEYMNNSVHVNAPGVANIVQVGFYEPPFDNSAVLNELFTDVPNIDIFQKCHYVFTTTTPYSGPNFQNTLQEYVTSDSQAIVQLKNHDMMDVPFYIIRQVHDDPSTPNLYRWPNKKEILCGNNIALAYGAKGIVYYLYGSLTGGVDGLITIARTTTDQYDSVKAIHDNYQNSGKTFSEIGSEFINLTWEAGYSVHNHTSEPIDGNYELYDVQSRLPGGSDDSENETYVEAGILQDASDNFHYMIVNRRCVADREVTVTFESISNHAYLITDIFNEYETRYLPANGSTFEYSFTLGPGEGKLLKLEDIGTWAGTISSNTTWLDKIIMNDNITVNNGVALSISPGANIEVAENKRLTVNGSIQAGGTSVNPITLTRSGSSGNWYGIRIDNSTANSNLDYCTVEHSDNGIRLYQTSGTVAVDHCRLENNSFGFASQYSSPIYI